MTTDLLPRAYIIRCVYNSDTIVHVLFGALLKCIFLLLCEVPNIEIRVDTTKNGLNGYYFSDCYLL